MFNPHQVTKEFEKALSASEKLLAEYKKEERILQKDVTEAILKLTEEQGKLEEKEDFNADISGVRILLVEDNELNAEIAEFILTENGAKVETVKNGLEAVQYFEACESGTYDVILMDVMMPVMDGLTATKTIRSLERQDAKTIPIIAMTANAFREDAEKCMEAGMNAHLAKPLDDKTIKQTICEELRSSRDR
jgi:CheY-like chemotaxis protein